MVNQLKAGVLALQGEVSEHLRKINQCGASSIEVKRPADLENLDALIIPGGESTTIGKLMHECHLAEAVKKYCQSNLAVMGTCAGMVLLAREVLDGNPAQFNLGLMDIKVKRNAFGRQRESFEEELTFKGLDHRVKGVFIRAPVVAETGPGVEALSSVKEGIVAVGQGNCLAVSFHPELTESLEVHRFFLKAVAGNFKHHL